MVVSDARARWAELPIHLWGHSMGGLIVARYAQRRPGAVDRVVMTSSALGVSIKVPVVKEVAGQIVEQICAHRVAADRLASRGYFA